MREPSPVKVWVNIFVVFFIEITNPQLVITVLYHKNFKKAIFKHNLRKDEGGRAKGFNQFVTDAFM